MLASRAQRTATLLAVLALFAIGFVPLFAGPGYEAALAAGLVLPALAATATAFDVVRSDADAFAALARGAASGVWLASIGLVVCFVHGVREGFCDAAEGTELLLLGPCAGSVLGGVWGGVAGLVARARLRAPGDRTLSRRQRALVVALAVAAPIAGIVASVVRFYTSPMVFAFDPFVGFFAGTLYDSVITGMGRLVTYRMGSLATLVAAFAGAALLRPELGGPRVAARKRPAVAALAVAAAVASVTHWLQGAKMGHYQSAATIRDALGQRLTHGRCELVYPTGTPKLEALALARECDAHLGQLDRFFGVKGPAHVVAFVFASADQKGYLMGAAGTYIAKPWRREIYIQRAGFPHPVMRHELAHVEAGTFGAGPFRVAGPFRGLIPDPGRIEGVAVAAAPRDEVLSLDEWAKAMRDLKLLPPLDRVFRLSFLGEPSSRAYIVAGAFVDWLRREKGVDVMRGWYSGQSLESLTKGTSLAELERSWQASLDRLEVGEDVLQVARARFDQPAIFGRRCPHVVDRLGGDAGGALAQFDTAKARALYEQLLDLDPHDLGARLGLATCAQRDGADGTARSLYEKIGSDSTLPRAARARALEALGDLALAAGQAPEARRRFEQVRAVVVDPDRLRTLDVKEYAADAPGRNAIVLHLLGDPVLGRSATAAAAALGAWSEREPEQGLADYLLARTYAGEARYPLVATSLDSALGKKLPVASVIREAHKLRLITACALGDRERVEDTYGKWLSLAGPRPPERAEVGELVERCTGRPPPAPVSIAPPANLPGPATSATPMAPPQDKSTAPASPSGASRCPEGMALIPAGETWLGSARGQGVSDEWPRYRTRLAAFCMDHTEVTVDAYSECVQSGKCTPADAKRVTCTASHHAANFPINCVDAAQAEAFCASRGGRLPSEAEWEYAASGGDDRLYSWGNEPPDGRACWKHAGACAVGSFGAGAFGLFDMTGNVWEWTSTGYGDYPWPAVESPNRVYRGGGWSRRFEKWMRVRLRNRVDASQRGSHLGFRCARSLEGEPCPFGAAAAADQGCLAGVLEADCREGKSWNGSRCAPPGEAACGERHVLDPGHGCVWATKIPESSRAPPDLAAVKRARSPEFDHDCKTFQPSRPRAHRFEGGSHEARNAVARVAGCKNRDVGVGWNSACCP